MRLPNSQTPSPPLPLHPTSTNSYSDKDSVSFCCWKKKIISLCYKKHIALKFLCRVSQENWSTKKSESSKVPFIAAIPSVGCASVVKSGRPEVTTLPEGRMNLCWLNEQPSNPRARKELKNPPDVVFMDWWAVIFETDHALCLKFLMILPPIKCIYL